MLVTEHRHLTLIGSVDVILTLVRAGAGKSVIGVGMPIVSMPPVSHIIDLLLAVALLFIPLVLIEGAARWWRCTSWLHSCSASPSASWSARKC